MMHNRKVTIIGTVLLVTLFAGSVAGQGSEVESLQGSQATLEEILYLPSGKTVKKLSLGYSSLLADVYWTRAVQYFGASASVARKRYDLLAPLLNITTDLDPNLIVAYETRVNFSQPEAARRRRPTG